MPAALACLVLAFAILTGLFQANTRYFYCDAMGLLRADPCAASVRAAHRDDLPPANDEVSRTPFTCCSTGVLGAIPSSTAPGEVRVPAAKLVAFVALPSALAGIGADLASPVLVPPPLRAHRLRVPPRSARELRAQSMVFLT